jgi:hypothetical protein
MIWLSVLQMSSSIKLAEHHANNSSCLISMNLVDAAFGYQRDIIQLSHESEMEAARKEHVIKKNEALVRSKQRYMERVCELKIEKNSADAKLKEKMIRISDLRDLSYLLVDTNTRNKQLSPENILKCKQVCEELKSFENS